jgi:hypothetical protein
VDRRDARDRGVAAQQRFLSLREPMRKAREASETIDELTRSSEPHTIVTMDSGWLNDMAVNLPRALGTMAAVLLVYFFRSLLLPLIRQWLPAPDG